MDATRTKMKIIPTAKDNAAAKSGTRRSSASRSSQWLYHGLTRQRMGPIGLEHRGKPLKPASKKRVSSWRGHSTRAWRDRRRMVARRVEKHRVGGKLRALVALQIQRPVVL